MEETGEYIAVDVGAARVGLARGSLQAKLAEPLKTVPAAEAVETLAALAKQSSAAGIVIGLPRNLNGEETTQTQTVREWIETAKAKIDLPFYAQDETLTTKLAGARAANQGRKPVDEDALAAAIILQDFLDSPPTARALI